MTDPNVNVTLEDGPVKVKRTFPCPLCGSDLELRPSRRNKPYCICNPCGVQIFFRGKDGIARLNGLLEQHGRVVGATSVATPAIAAFNRLEQLRAHKKELQQRRPLIFTDEDLEHTISAVDREIARLQVALVQMSGDTKR